MLEFNKRNITTWSMTGPSGALGMVATDLAENDNDFAVVTSDLCYFSGLDRMKAKYPDKLYNVGIAEQNMVNVSAGMVNEGMKVLATTYATFASMRVADQVKVSMGYMGIPVVLIGLTAGYTAGILGATHMGLEDIAVMRSIPNITVLSPADCTETVKCIYAAIASKRPTYIRMNGGSRCPIIYPTDYDFEIGKAIQLRKGKDILLYATGIMVKNALDVADRLEQEGISCTVVDMHSIKPIDEEYIKDNLDYRLIVSLEEHSVIGGLGSAISEKLSPIGKKPPMLMIGVEDKYLNAANTDYLIDQSGLSVDKVYEKISAFYEEC